MKSSIPFVFAAAVSMSILVATVPTAAAASSTSRHTHQDNMSRQQRQRSHNRRRRRVQEAETSDVDDGSSTISSSSEQDGVLATAVLSSAEEEQPLSASSSSEGEPATPAAAPLSSPATAIDMDYNTRIEPCPGLEERSIRGYASLTALQQDLAEYFDSFTTQTPTTSPTDTLSPTTATKSPTLKPTTSPTDVPSNGPTKNPTGSPSEIPTKAPITLRPTPFPTSMIRQKALPTISPAPTIKIKIVGGAGVSFAGPTGPAGPSPDPAGDVPTLDSVGTMMDNEGMQPRMVNVDHPNSGRTRRGLQDMGGEIQGDAMNSQLVVDNIGLTEEVRLDDTGMDEDDDDGAGTGFITVTTQTMGLDDESSSESSGITFNGQEGGGGGEAGFAPQGAESGGAGGLLISSNGEGEGEGGEEYATTATSSEIGLEDESMNSMEPQQVTDENYQQHVTSYPTTTTTTTPPVSFQICPNSQFEFKDTFSLVENFPPLVIETPLKHHPIEIRCMSLDDNVLQSGNCVLSGGDVHLLIRHNSYDEYPHDNKNMAEEETAVAVEHHPITISGITFRSSHQSSIHMQDPRGKVTFHNCKWEDNEGVAALMVDGRYNATEHHQVLDSDNNDNDSEGGITFTEGEPAGNNDDPNDETTGTFSTIDWSIMVTTEAIVSTKNPPKSNIRDRALLSEDEETEEDDDYDDEEEMTTMATPFSREGWEMEAGRTTVASKEPEFDPLIQDDESFHWEEQWLVDDFVEEEEEMLIHTHHDEEDTTMLRRKKKRKMRLLGAVEAVPRSIISIEYCSFSGNKGNATIMVSSYSDELTLAEQDPGVLNHNDDLLNADNDNDMNLRWTGDLQEDQESAKEQPSGTGASAPLSHSIHLSLKDTTFELEDVDTSIIENFGGRLQSTGCSFVNNTAESIIRSEYGTVAITRTEFTTNDLRGRDDEGGGGSGGGGSLIVLDSESALEVNEDTCVSATSNNANEAYLVSDANENKEGNGMDSFNRRRQRQLQQADGVSAQESETSAAEETQSATTVTEEGTAIDNTAPAAAGSTKNFCEGINSGGICNSFELCQTTPTDNEETSPNAETALIEEASTVEEDLEACFRSWDNLVTAVRDQPKKGQRDFIICSGATLLVTESPVVIDSDYITIQCGEEYVIPQNKNCVISGGRSHFHITGSSKGVQLSRLIMKGSTASSIMALGTIDATLNLIECEWAENEGASAILIANTNADEGGDDLNTTVAERAAGGKAELDIALMLESPSGIAMSVDVTQCTFVKNPLTFGAITNLGGTLSVYKSKFAENEGKGGDIVVSNKGSCTVQGSCFNASSSVLPGVIFVGKDSVVNGNTDNFGFGVSAGAYEAGDGGGISATCMDIFQEAEGDSNDCLDSSTCQGSCAQFSSTVCQADISSDESILIAGNSTEGGEGSQTAAPTTSPGQIYVPAQGQGKEDETSGSTKIVPIIVAVIVCVFIVLGLVGIIMRRRKVASNNTNSSDEIDGLNDAKPSLKSRFEDNMCCCLKGRKDKNNTDDVYNEEQVVENGDHEYDDIDNDVA